MTILKRLAALEGAAPDDPQAKVKAVAHAHELLEFVKTTFPQGGLRCPMDHLANCCGLPSAQYMTSVLDDGGTPEAFEASAMRATQGPWTTPDSLPKAEPNNWRAQMVKTAEHALSKVHHKHGNDGLRKLLRLFPLVLNAMQAAGVIAPGKKSLPERANVGAVTCVLT